MLCVLLSYECAVFTGSHIKTRLAAMFVRDGASVNGASHRITKGLSSKVDVRFAVVTVGANRLDTAVLLQPLGSPSTA